jgi:hypothetical protein
MLCQQTQQFDTGVTRAADDTDLDHKPALNEPTGKPSIIGAGAPATTGKVTYGASSLYYPDYRESGNNQNALSVDQSFSHHQRVCWFAGLFYLPRLFVYHAQSEDTVSKERFSLMERKLYRGIMGPAMIATLIFGGWLITSTLAPTSARAAGCTRN